jgi:hypothetical protein
MKNTLKLTFFTILLILLSSCTNDKDPLTSLNGFELRDVSESPSPAVLLNANAAQTYKKLEWDRADYGVSTSATYTISVTDHDKDPNFLNPVESSLEVDPNPDARKATLTVKGFNDLISKLTTFNCGVMNIDIRVKSTIGSSTNKQVQYTEPKTVSVVGYSTTPRVLAFVKDSQSPSNAPKIISSNFDKLDDFQGYIYLEAGNYKFYEPDGCGSYEGAKVYGTSSGDAIVEGSEANSINVTTSGHYFVTVNLNTEGTGARTFKLSYYKAFGIFGTAIRTVGSVNMVPMTDDNNTNVWKLTIELFKGRLFKFKSSDWTAALTGTPPSVPSASSTIITTLGGGGFPITSGVESSLFDFGTNLPGKDIKVPGDNDGTKQKYDVVIDVSKPRNYTCKLTIAE